MDSSGLVVSFLMSRSFLRFGRAAVAVGRLVVDYRQTLYSRQYPDTEAYEVSYY